MVTRPEKVFSFSVLIHRGGRTDTYAQSRSNDELIRTGTLLPDILRRPTATGYSWTNDPRAVQEFGAILLSH